MSKLSLYAILGIFIVSILMVLVVLLIDPISQYFNGEFITYFEENKINEDKIKDKLKKTATKVFYRNQKASPDDKFEIIYGSEKYKDRVYSFNFYKIYKENGHEYKKSMSLSCYYIANDTIAVEIK